MSSKIRLTQYHFDEPIVTDLMLKKAMESFKQEKLSKAPLILNFF